jgi:hypothetical protein
MGLPSECLREVHAAGPNPSGAALTCDKVSVRRWGLTNKHTSCC